MRVERLVIPAHIETTYYYKYSELSDSAREKANEWYLEGQESFIFTEDAENDLNQYWFPNSKLEVGYSLGYCQGDYFDFCGTLKLKGVQEHIKEKFTEEEQKFINWLMKEFNPTYKISREKYNKYDDSMEDTRDDLHGYYYPYHAYKNVKWNIVDKFEREAGEFLSDLAEKFKKWGYEYFYEVPEDMEDICDCNGWEFDEEGNMIA